MLERFTRQYQYILLIALIIILIPMTIVGFYNRPTVDDLYQPYSAMLLLKSGESLWNVVKATAAQVRQVYNSYCGTFFTMFLSYLPPMAFDYRLAWIHPIFLLFFLCGACFRAASCLTCINPDMPKSIARCAAVLMSCCLLLLMPSIAEGIYWYSGAINYTFSFLLSVYLFSDIFSFTVKQTTDNPVSLIRVILCCLGCVLLGGGSFCTAAVSSTLSVYYIVYLFYAKRPKLSVWPCLCIILGFLVSVLAPGNFMRQGGSHYPYVTTFIRSFFEAYQMIFQDMRLWIFSLFFVPIILAALPWLPFQYRHPIMTPCVSLTLLAASIVPVMYSYVSTGAARQLNAHFFLLCFLLIFNLAYMLGWVRRLILEHYTLKPCKPVSGNLRLPYTYTAAILVIFLGVALRNVEFTPSLVFNCDLPPIKAVTNLADGSLRAFADQYDSMVDALKAYPDKDIVITEQPSNSLLGLFVITSDVDDWYNQSFAHYYGGRSIVYLPENSENELHR